MNKRIVCGIAVFCFAVMSGCTGAVSVSGNMSQENAKSSSESGAAASVSSAVPATDIGEAAAKKIALDHAELTEDEVTFIKSKLDYDDGHRVYDVEFYTGGKEYDYEIDTETGDIRSYDYDAESYNAGSASSSGKYISEDEARRIALDKAGFSESEVVFTKSKLDYDHGIAVYEIEFREAAAEHEFDISAETGEIAEYDIDYD